MKKLRVLSIVIIIIMVLSNTIYASDLTSGIDIPSGGQGLDEAGNKILGAVQVVGTIVSVGMLMIIGIKYMLASTEEKAEYKKTFWVYIVGAIFVFSIANLAEVIYNVINSI